MTSISTATASSEPCSPCSNPDDSYSPEFAGRSLEIPGYGTLTCGFLETTIPLLLTQGQEDCKSTQAVGSYCGCPPLDPIDPCQLVRSRLVIDEESSSFSSNSPDTNSTAGGTTTTTEISSGNFCESIDPSKTVTGFPLETEDPLPCLLAESILQSSFSGSSAECRVALAQWQPICCTDSSIPENGTKESSPNDGENSQDGKSVALISEGCPLCRHGNGEMANPDYNLGEFFNATQDNEWARVAFEIGGSSSVATCSMAEALLKSGFLEEDACESDEYFFLAALCGCPPVDTDPCTFCPTNDIDRPDAILPYMSEVYGTDSNCATVDLSMSQFSSTDKRCWIVKSQAHLCGCNDGVPWYLGASTTSEHKVLTWLPRGSGFLSLIGSLYIIRDVVSRLWKRQTPRSLASSNSNASQRKTDRTYYLLMLMISIFDCSSSAAWIVSTAALPAADSYGTDSGVYGANGTDSSCTAQGFFMELGFIGSTTATASLMTYYLLSIVYNFRESRLEKVRKWLLAIPAVLAISFACAAVPFYEPFFVACFIANPNSKQGESWVPLTIFSLAPVGLSLLLSSAQICLICYFVGKNAQRHDRWRFSSSEDISLDMVAPDTAAEATQERDHHTPPSRNTSLESDVTALGPRSINISLHPSEDSVGLSQLERNRPRRPRRRKRTNVEMAVFWQACMYVLAFLLTWSFYMVAQIKPYFTVNDHALFVFWAFVVTFNPLMGFWNAVIYIKPWDRWIGWCGKRDTKAPVDGQISS